VKAGQFHRCQSDRFRNVNAGARNSAGVAIVFLERGKAHPGQFRSLRRNCAGAAFGPSAVTRLRFFFFRAATIPFVKEAEILQSGPNTLTCRIDRGGPVTISLFGNLSFGQLAAPDLVAPAGVKVASLADLMATKLKTVFQRSESKDYIDIATMIRAGISLDKGLAGAIALFGPNFNPALPLKALTYFGDGDLGLVLPETREYLIAAVKQVHEFPKVTPHARIIGSLTPDPE
jgi:hypothetical protein